MKPSSFNDRWSEIYDFAWRNLKDAQSYIEKIGAEEGSTDNQVANLGNESSSQGVVILEEIKL